MVEKNELKSIYALIGKNISYSFSKGYFSQKFLDENINAEYVNFDISSLEMLPSLLSEYQQLKGMNVTIPYKEAIIPYLDELDEIAEQIGAVNTIKILPNGKLKGYNTDYYGFWKSLKPLLKSQHSQALILGTGGASKAVAFALQQAQIPYKFVSRTPRDGAFSYEQLTHSLIENYKLIINCTPLGTSPDVQLFPPISYQFLTSEHLLFDLIYNPPKTAFLTKGEQNGASICNGYQMLVFQAEAAWEIWNDTTFKK